MGRDLVVVVCLLALPVVATATDPVAYEVVDFAIPKPLTNQAGDAARGAEIARDRQIGNCLSCHVLGDGDDFPGTIGPSLAGVGARYTAGQLRLRVVDPKVINPASMMPGFYKTAGLNRVMKEFEGRPVLNAQQVEDVVAFLVSLR